MPGTSRDAEETEAAGTTLGPARGILLAVLLSSALWIGIAIAVRTLW
ncbi:hypothetical protein [Paracraurococcus ruber]|nr:hypothetical protein [Paracraurococcus ruber]